MSKLTKMMVARSTGVEPMGFDMRSESERRGSERRMYGDSEMRMGGYDRTEGGGARYERGESMRMGGYESPESVRRSPRTGRFVRSEMEGGHEMRMSQEKWRGGNDLSRYDEHGRPLEKTKRMQSRYREHEEDDEDEDMEFSEKIADEWTKAMKNEDGSKGPHWSREQTRAVMVQHGIVCDPLEFFAIMNSIYSDFSAVAKRYGVDRPDFYAHMAKAWLEDKDAVEDKAAAYYECVVKHDGQKKHSPSKVRAVGDSEFLKSVNGKDSTKAWEIMDELMETLYSLGHTRVYDSVMRRMEEL